MGKPVDTGALEGRVGEGTAAAFVTTPQAPHISEDLIHYVSVFVPDHSGDHYVPHVSIGVGTTDFLKTLSSAPFDDFTFSPAAPSVYHLGKYGTAIKNCIPFR